MTDDQREYAKWIKEKTEIVSNRSMEYLQNLADKKIDFQLSKHDVQLINDGFVDDRVLQRRFGIMEAAKMVGVSHTLIYSAEKDGRLPDPEYRKDTKKKVRAGYTINHINHMRDVFGTRPSRPEGLPSVIAGLLNLKGGSHKTTNCQLFAQFLAMRGYKVLVLDTDPQGSLSFFFGKRPDINVTYENTMAPYLLEDDEALVAAGLEPGSSESLDYAVQPTYWDDIDIIPACLQNLNIDLLMPKIMEDANIGIYDRIMKLREGLLGLSNDYDFILIDGTPSLNLSTLNVLSACDMCFVPTPASLLDFASTVQFSTMLADTIESYEDQGQYPNIPELRYFITKFSSSQYSEFMEGVIRKVLTVERGDVLTAVAHNSDEIGKANAGIYSIYERNPSDPSVDNRKKLKRTIESFNALYAEMHDVIWDVCYGRSPKPKA